MKVAWVALSILMVMAFNSLASPIPMGSNYPTTCCFSYINCQIRRKIVTDYYEISSLCPQPAVVFKTKRGQQVCANPKDAWVQKYVEDLEMN